MPTTADIAPLMGESSEKVDSFLNRSIQVLRLAGLSGFPQVSLPSGQRLGALLGGAVPAGPARQRHGHDLAGPQWIAELRWAYAPSAVMAPCPYPPLPDRPWLPPVP